MEFCTLPKSALKYWEKKSFSSIQKPMRFLSNGTHFRILVLRTHPNLSLALLLARKPQNQPFALWLPKTWKAISFLTNFRLAVSLQFLACAISHRFDSINIVDVLNPVRRHSTKNHRDRLLSFRTCAGKKWATFFVWRILNEFLPLSCFVTRFRFCFWNLGKPWWHAIVRKIRVGTYCVIIGVYFQKGGREGCFFFDFYPLVQREIKFFLVVNFAMQFFSAEQYLYFSIPEDKFGFYWMIPLSMHSLSKILVQGRRWFYDAILYLMYPL